MRRVASLTLALAGLAFSSVAFAGDEAEDHENYLKADELDTGDVVIKSKKAIAQEDHIALKLEIQNSTSDWIFLKKHEMVIDADGQELKPYDGKEKPSLIIEPDKKKSLSLKLKGSGLHVEEATVTFSGLYKANAKGEVLKLGEFQLPPSQNNVDVGSFSCDVTFHDQATKITTTKWECTYNGDGIGYIDASQIGVKIQTGAEFGNTFRKNKEAMLTKGESAKFTSTFEIEKRIIDMQFATMQLQWRKTFSESKIQPLDAEDMEFELDEELTAEKNAE